MSAFTKPIVVNPDGKVVQLERLPLGGNGDGQFSEKWLKEALYANPQSLPIKEIDPHIGKLIPICTEIETGAGPADILYVTVTGQLVLIETKLWRNPEARREVVAQILDYAKQLTGWTFDDLARQAAITTGKGSNYLLSRFKEFAPDADEAAFVDGINLSLRTGDFLLLIVGDGIRSGAEGLIGFIERYGNLRFGFGLIEVAAFKLPYNEGILLQPRILARIEILQRTVLLGPSGPIEFEQIADAEDVDTKTNADAAWFQKFWSEYLAMLSLDDATQPLPKLPKTTNIFFYMPPAAGSAWISAYISQSVHKGGVYLTFAKSFDRANEFYESLFADKDELEKIVGTTLIWKKEDSKIYISVPYVQMGDLNSPEERQRVISYLAKFSNSMVNAFRPRLEVLSKKLAI